MRYVFNHLSLSLAVILVSVSACDTTSNSRIDETEFWQIVEKVKRDDGDEAHALRLQGELGKYPAPEILNFYRLFITLHDNAYEEKVWAAGMLLNGGHGSDDGFEYFRNWLISRGKIVYNMALTSPDNLADEFVPYIDGYPAAEFESYRYVIYDVYKDKTGHELFEDLKEDIPTPKSDAAVTGWTDYENDEKIKKNLPKLWEKYGSLKQAFDKRVEEIADTYSKGVQEVDVEGLGKIRVGDTLVHKSYGKGKVVFLMSNMMPEIPGYQESRQVVMGKLKFGEDIHPMLITTENLKKP